MAQQDLDAARSLISAQVVPALTNATAAVAAGSRSAEAIASLGSLIKTATTLGFESTSQLAAARAAYAGQLEGNFSASDLAFIEKAVEFADSAGVKLPGDIFSMALSAKRVRAAAAQSGDTAQELERLVAAVHEGENAGPAVAGSDDLAAAKVKAKAKAVEQLQAAISSANAQLVKTALDVAVTAGVSAVDLEAARAVINAQAAPSF